ncbi:HAD family hydrolase [Calditrichota bacterium]
MRIEIQNTNKKYIAFFDLDKTLLDGISGKILIHNAYKYGILKSHYILQGFYLSLLHKFGFMNPDRIIVKMVNCLKGVSESSLVNLINKIFNEEIKTLIRDKAVTEIKDHHSNNGHTVILSASLFQLCEPIKDFLKMDDLICSELEISNGLFTGKSNSKYCYGPVKLKRAIEYCKKYNFSIDQAYFYSDSISDLPLLKAVGHPMCVSPDNKLLQIAQMKKWTICDW